MDDAIGKDERLFDAMRAATLLTPWLYGMGRYPEVRSLCDWCQDEANEEAWVMAGRATRSNTVRIPGLS